MIRLKTKYPKILGLGAFTLFLALFLAVSVQAGWVEVDQNGGRSFLSNGKVLNIADGEWSMIDSNTGEISLADSGRKVYTSGTVDEICGAMSAMQSEFMKQQSEMMKQMPPEQRKMMEEMEKKMKNTMKAETPPKVSMEKTGPGEKIAGYKTIKYRIKVNDTPYGEIWVSDDASLSKAMADFGKKIHSVMQKFSTCMQEGMPMDSMPPSPEDSPAYQEIVEKSWVLKEVVQGEGVTEVVELKEEPIPDSKFKTPAGYQKVSVLDFYHGQMGEMGME